MKKLILLFIFIASCILCNALQVKKITNIDYTYHIQNINNILKWHSKSSMKHIKEYHNMFKDHKYPFSTIYKPLSSGEFSQNKVLFDAYEELMINQTSLNKKLENYIINNDQSNSIITLKNLKRNFIILNLINASIDSKSEIKKIIIEKDKFHFNLHVPLEKPFDAINLTYNYREDVSLNKIDKNKIDELVFDDLISPDTINNLFYVLEFIGNEYDITNINKYTFEQISKKNSGTVTYTSIQPTHVIGGQIVYSQQESSSERYDYHYELSHTGSYDINLIRINDNEKLYLNNSKPTQYTTRIEYDILPLSYLFNEDGFLECEIFGGLGRFDRQTILFDSRTIYDIKNNILNKDFILTDYSFVKNQISERTYKDSKSSYLIKKIVSVCDKDTTFHIQGGDYLSSMLDVIGKSKPPYAWLCDNGMKMNNEFYCADQNNKWTCGINPYENNLWMSGINPKTQSYSDVSNCNFDEIQKNSDRIRGAVDDIVCENLKIEKVFELVDRGIEIDNMGYLKNCENINNTFLTFKGKDIYKKNNNIFIVINALEIKKLERFEILNMKTKYRDNGTISSESWKIENSEKVLNILCEEDEYILIELKENIEKSNFYFLNKLGKKNIKGTKFNKLSLVKDRYTSSESERFSIPKNLLIKAIKRKLGIIEGCKDSTAFNYYDPFVNADDGSCCYTIGCTDSIALNYNPNACKEDGSCQFLMFPRKHKNPKYQGSDRKYFIKTSSSELDSLMKSINICDLLKIVGKVIDYDTWLFRMYKNPSARSGHTAGYDFNLFQNWCDDSDYIEGGYNGWRGKSKKNKITDLNKWLNSIGLLDLEKKITKRSCDTDLCHFCNKKKRRR